MKPEIDKYQIVMIPYNREYKVATPYDLFTMPHLKLTGKDCRTLEEAKNELIRIYERDMNEYERLNKMGRSFPNND